MTVPQDTVRWRNASQGQGSCVDLAHTGNAVRDSKNPDGPTLSVSSWSGLVAFAKAARRLS